MTCENCEVPEGYVAVVHVPVTAEEVEARKAYEVFSPEHFDRDAENDRIVNRPSARFRAAILRLPVPPPPIEVGCRGTVHRVKDGVEVLGAVGQWLWLRSDDDPDEFGTYKRDEFTHASDCPNHGSGT